MFRGSDAQLDLSHDLREVEDWNIGTFRRFEYPLDISALAIDPTCGGLLGVGTASGSIYIFGGLGVQCKLVLPDPVGIKFLQFSSYTNKILCIDIRHRLHVWDLSIYGKPKFLITAHFDPISSFTLSPSHSHAFIALESGNIRTYDLACLRKSPYTIPNLWLLYVGKLATSGMSEGNSPTAQTPIETAIHPRDLNLLFIAYAGGVILSDLTQRNTVRAYELVFTPGAPGGAGYRSATILTHRRPSVTALAIHPAGHLFAVGYDDGSIAVWAIEDEEKPILVRTLDEIDVDVVDGYKMEEYLPREGKDAPASNPPPDREPIFKLSWSGFSNSSDPRGGETALVILGGLVSGDSQGITVHWLPAFNPPEPPVTSSPNSQSGLTVFTRRAIRDSVIASKTYLYPSSSGVTQDFLLVPRENPHFAGAFDPHALLVLSEAPGDTRAIKAYQFPPPSFCESEPTDSEDETSVEATTNSETLAEDLASAIQDLKVNDEPQLLRLPDPLYNGNEGVVGVQLVKLERDAYEQFTGYKHDDGKRLPLEAGVAWMSESQGNELRLAKYQPRRILISQHRDLKVRFDDISAQLLMSFKPTPIQTDFPNPLHDLTVDVYSVLTDAAVVRRLSLKFLNQARIKSVYLAPESLECAIVFQNGEVVVYRRSAGSVPYREADDKELVILEHVPILPGQRFHPYFMLAPERGPALSFAISDIGFLATGYVDGSLIIVDMRRPCIILRYDKTPKVSHGFHLGRHSEMPDPISSLTWTVSSTLSDPHLRVRLIAVHLSGHAKVFTISRLPNSSWGVDGDSISMEAVSNPLPQETFVLDSNSGTRWRADRHRFAASLEPPQGNASHSIWITAGIKGVRCYANINGDRLGKAEWPSKHGSVQSVQVIERNGSQALVAFTDRHAVLAYSLPELDLINTIQRPVDAATFFSVDETGDFIASTRHPASGLVELVTYASLFDIRRVYTLPEIDLTTAAHNAYPQPQPVSIGPTSLLSSWFRFGQSMTGEQLDTLLGGPDRPLVRPKPQVARNLPSENSIASGASAIAGAAASAQSNLYTRLSSALSERGQMLGDLEDRFNSLEEGSKGMVAQAKRLATQKTAKTWFGL